MKLNAAVFLFAILCVSLAGWAQVPNAHLKLWLSADSIEITNDKVSTWYDQSENDFHLTQSNANARPVILDSALNNLPAVSFDGIDDFLSVDFGELFEQPNTFFIIFSSNVPPSTSAGIFDGITTHGSVFTHGAGNNLVMASNPSAPTSYLTHDITPPFGPLVATTIFNGNNSFLHINTTVVDSGPQGNLSLSDLQLGRRTWASLHYSKVNISEFIYYDTILSNTDRQAIETYLMDKYAPPLNLSEDIIINYGFCDTALIIDKSFTDILWSTGETNDTICVNQTGQYWVQATDIFGRIKYDTINVEFPNPNIQNTSICLGDSVLYEPSLIGSYDYLWSDTGTENTKYIKNAGDYWLRIEDSFGCFDTVFFSVEVDSFKNKISLGNDTSLCSGNTISLIEGEALCNAFLWTTNGNTSPSQIVTESGWQKIVVENTNGCSASDSIYVTIVGTAPTPDYVVENLCFGDTTQFIDNSTPQGDISSWKWIINENDTLYTQNAEWVFETTGEKNIELLIASESGCANNLTFTINILPIPDVSFSYFPVCTGVEMNFISNVIISGESSINQYNWSIDGSSYSNEENFNYLFSENGIYNLSLDVQLTNTCTANYSEIISVNNNYPLPENLSMVSPYDNYNISSANAIITFSWNTSTNTNYYSLQLSDNIDFNNIIFDSITINNNINLNLNYNLDTIFWRVISYNPCLENVNSETRLITALKPSDAISNKLWLSSDSVLTNNNKVSIWYDQSGNENNLTQNNASFQPDLICCATNINNKPVISFDGLNDYMSVDFLQEYTQPNTFFIIFNSSLAPNVSGGIIDGITEHGSNFGISSSNYLYMAASPSAPAPYVTFDIFSPFDYLLAVPVFNNDNSNLTINNLFQVESNLGNLPTSDLQIGRRTWYNTKYSKINVAELIFYDTLLNETETDLVHQYLRHKYAPPVNLGYDINVPYGFCDTTITGADKPWFTDYLWSTGDTTATISTNHNGEYSVTVTDIFGFTSTDDIRVNFPRVYQADALSMVCDGDTLVWDTGLPTESYNFNWLNSASTQAYAGYWQNQQAAVQITDTNGCSFFTDTVDIMLDMFEHTAALGDGDTALCIGNRLTLANGFDEAVTFLWQDGSTEPEYLIETAGTYHVTVSNALGCTARDTIDVSILGTVPEPDFTVSGQCAEASIQLNDASSSTDGNITNWEWSTNNEIFATGESSSISFDSMGIYDIQLEIFTDVGCHQSISQSIQIHPLPEPDFSPLTACSNQPELFENLSSIPQGNMQSSEWQFGSGSEWISADMQAITHEFANAGMQAVSLSVTSEIGCEKQISKQVEVRQSPQAAFSTSPRCDGEAVIFWNQTDAQGTQLWEYQWNFGDGNNSTASDPQHLYPDTGNYTVNMSVKSLNGCTDTASMTITVYSLPQAAVENLNACLGVAHQLADITDASAGAIVAREWQVAGLQLTGENPSIQLDSLGSYPLTLHVTTEYGCTSQIDTLLMVRKNPDADFELPQTWGAVPLSLSLENTSLGGDSYIWHFGDGESANDENPQHVWQDSGNYKIQLIAVSPYGCTDSLSKNLRVIIPLVDVGIIALQTEMADNYLQVSADIINPGTVPITDLALELDPGNGEITREILPNEFAEGAVMRYTFNSQPYFASGKLPEYVCVSLDPGVPDDVPENNQLCNLHDAGFSLQSMYPNPVNDLLNLHVVLPRDGNLQVQLFDAVGQQVKSLNLELNSGYHALALDCASLSSGRYQVRLSFEEEEIVKTIVIQ
jgi:PKD repeat protein